MARPGCWMMMIFAVLVLVLSSCFVDASKEEGGEQVIYVGGKVLCQDCSQGYKEWVEGAKPIKGSRVSITCSDERRRVMYYGSDETDEAGDFEMTLNKFVNGKELDPKKCSVRLVSSPDPVCNYPTDFAGGNSGVWLKRPTVVYRDLIRHVLGPFYYTTPMCGDPDTEDSDPDTTNQEKQY